MKVIAIIPSRLASQRLPRKPLADISGKPMIQWVYEAASNSKLISNVYVATDSQEIADVCNSFGAKSILTDSEIPSGTDRIAVAYEKLDSLADIVINIQGDEPFITSEMLDSFVQFFSGKNFDVATLISKIKETDDIANPSVVKVALSKENYAVYFSRSPVPHFRDIPIDNWCESADYWKHIGIYAYKPEALKRFTELPQSNLEQLEKLEQLRLLEDGAKFLCYETDLELLAIDTPEDLEKAGEKMSTKMLLLL
jgi:3-deoxy-manno-octulosonate cytidylyltransferase (CMP-KDO synthetase)